MGTFDVPFAMWRQSRHRSGCSPQPTMSFSAIKLGLSTVAFHLPSFSWTFAQRSTLCWDRPSRLCPLMMQHSLQQWCNEESLQMKLPSWHRLLPMTMPHKASPSITRPSCMTWCKIRFLRFQECKSHAKQHVALVLEIRLLTFSSISACGWFCRTSILGCKRIAMSHGLVIHHQSQTSAPPILCLQKDILMLRSLTTVQCCFMQGPMIASFISAEHPSIHTCCGMSWTWGQLRQG